MPSLWHVCPQAVISAYEVLGNDSLREQYDVFGLAALGNKYNHLKEFLTTGDCLSHPSVASTDSGDQKPVVPAYLLAVSYRSMEGNNLNLPLALQSNAECTHVSHWSLTHFDSPNCWSKAASSRVLANLMKVAAMVCPTSLSSRLQSKAKGPNCRIVFWLIGLVTLNCPNSDHPACLNCSSSPTSGSRTSLSWQGHFHCARHRTAGGCDWL